MLFRSQIITSLQFQLDAEKKTILEYNILIDEQQNEITKLKNKIEFLEKELNKFKEIKEVKQEEPDTFFRRVSGWIYRS